MEPKYLLIVKVPKGIVVRDTPRPESQGGKPLRAVSVGGQLYAYGIHNIAGVEYARVVSINPLKPEWVRVAEADRSVVYVDVIELEPERDSNELANAINQLATSIRELARK